MLTKNLSALGFLALSVVACGDAPQIVETNPESPLAWQAALEGDALIGDVAVDDDGSIVVVGRYTGILTVAGESIETQFDAPRAFAMRVRGEGEIDWLEDVGFCYGACGKVALGLARTIHVAVDGYQRSELVVLDAKDGVELERREVAAGRTYDMAFCDDQVVTLKGPSHFVQTGLTLTGEDFSASLGDASSPPTMTCDGDTLIVALMDRGTLEVRRRIAGQLSPVVPIGLNIVDELEGIVVDGTGTVRIVTSRVGDSLIVELDENLELVDQRLRGARLLAVGSGDGRWLDASERDAIAIRALSGRKVVFERELAEADDISVLLDSPADRVIVAGEQDGAMFIGAL